MLLLCRIRACIKQYTVAWILQLNCTSPTVMLLLNERNGIWWYFQPVIVIHCVFWRINIRPPVQCLPTWVLPRGINLIPGKNIIFGLLRLFLSPPTNHWQLAITNVSCYSCCDIWVDWAPWLHLSLFNLILFGARWKVLAVSIFASIFFDHRLLNIVCHLCHTVDYQRKFFSSR